jgi:serine/threonine-protein kinase
MPNGSLSINALPWAEVYIDGEYAGTTPLGNVAVAIGSHDVVWRHPELGERRGTVSVPANTPARIGVDFSQ